MRNSRSFLRRDCRAQRRIGEWLACRAGKNSDANSDDWLQCRGVRERIRELQEENNRKSQLNREEALRWLAA